MNQSGDLNSDTPRSQIFHRDNIEELISNYIQSERKKERNNRKQDQNNNAQGSCYGTTFRRNASYTYGMNHLDNSFIEDTTMEWTMKNTQQELAEDYLELANSYMDEKNYEKAEKFLSKAKLLSPAKKIDEAMAKLASLKKGPSRSKARTSLFNENNEMKFNKLLREVNDQLRYQNFEEAEKLLMTAKELKHNEQVDNLITRLALLKQKAADDEYLNFCRNANKDECRKCVDMAKRLMNQQDYDAAEKWLLKAKRLYADKEVDLLLGKIYNTYNKDKASQLNHDEAQKCIQQAENHIAKKNYERAKRLLFKAKKLDSSINIIERVKRIEGLLKQQRKNSKNRSLEEEKKTEAKTFVHFAMQCMDDSNYDKAEEFLKKAKILDPELGVEHLLQSIEFRRQQSRKSQSYFFTIDMNKDEAERCVEMATDSMARKDFDKARKLLIKAKKLYPMPAIDEALKKLEKLELLSKSTNNNKNSDPGPSQKSQREYTKEQEEVVKRIMSCSPDQYFRILLLPRSANAEEVKKAFKKLALEVHPDKNYAPGAEEAFKRLKKAYEVLNPKRFTSSTQQEKESPKPNQNSSTKENHNQSNNNFQENSFNNSYQESSFNSRQRFNTSFERSQEESKPRDNYSNYYRQESNSFHFEQEEPSFNNPNFHRHPFYDNWGEEPTVDPNSGLSKTQLIVLTVFSTILVIYVGKYFFFNNSSHTTNHYHFEFYPEPTAEEFAVSQPNNLSTSETSESYSLIKFLTEIEYKKHLATVCSKIASTYDFLSEVKWRDHTVGFVSFFYENTKSMIIVMKSCLGTVGEFSYPYISAAYTKSTELCSSAYDGLVSYDWLNAWNKTKEISVSLVPWETLGRIKNSAVELAAKSYRSLVGPPVTETPQGTMGWIKDGCANLASSSYRSLVECNWSALWGSSNSSASEVPQDTIGWIKSSCISVGAWSWNLFAGHNWIYIWTKSKDLCIALIPWNAYEWLRNNYLNSSFALTCLKTGAHFTVSSITYVSQSIYSMIKGK